MKRAAISIALLLTASVGALHSAEPSTGAQQQGQQVLRAIKDLQEQQAAIAQNQTKIEEKIAIVAEAVRQARIYAARGGTKHQ